MPLYTLKDKKEDKEFDVFLSYQTLQETIKLSEGRLEQVFRPIRIVSGHGSLLSKTDNGWKEMLAQIKKGSGKGNTIRT